MPLLLRAGAAVLLAAIANPQGLRVCCNAAGQAVMLVRDGLL